MRTKLATWVLTIAAAAIGGAAAEAHHSAGVIFDLTQTISVEGVVSRFNLGNPHLRIYFTVTDDPREWMAEGGSRTVLLRRDWTADMLKPGDAITIVGHPARDGSSLVHVERLTLPDGRTLWAEDLPPPEAIDGLIRRRPAGQEP